MGHTTGQAIYWLVSQESPRHNDKETGSARRASCASSRLAIPPWRAGVPTFKKEHKSANLSLKNLLHFCMEDSKNPIASR
jgi:hypothetical protein